jgi:hypothetical protein
VYFPQSGANSIYDDISRAHLYRGIVRAHFVPAPSGLYGTGGTHDLGYVTDLVTNES